MPDTPTTPPEGAGAAAARSYRYDAFISYRHVEPDRGWAKWLHGALETYRVPKELVAKGLPKRLTRVFRDEEELPANADLSTQITAALEESKFLIVVCSPRAVESRWVNAEVEHFRKLGRHDRILALLIEGEPGKAFPPALTQIRRTLADASGQSREEIEEVEPLAADVRPDRNDEKAHVLRGHAQLRLLACILGCRFDELRQRETERRARRARVVAAGLVSLTLIMGGLAAFAFVQKGTADRQRRAAEAFSGLISEDIVQAAVEAEDPAAALMLTRAAAKIPDRFQKEPALLVNLSIVFGDALMRAGKPEEGLELFEQAQSAAVHVPIDSDSRLAIDNGIADARLRLTMTSAELARGRIRLDEAVRSRGRNDPLVMTLCNDFAGQLKNAKTASPEERENNLTESESIYAQVLADRTAVLGADHLDTLVTRHNLCLIALHRARIEFNALRPESPPADRDAALQKFLAALTDRRAVSTATRKALGPRHPQTLATWSDEVALSAEAGRLDPALLKQAIDEFPSMLDQLRRTLGVSHWRSLQVTGRYAQALEWAQRTAEAANQWLLLLEIGRMSNGAGNDLVLELTVKATDCLAAILERSGQLVQAERVLLRAHADAEATRDADLVERRRESVCDFYVRTGRADDAKAWQSRNPLPSPHGQPEK